MPHVAGACTLVVIPAVHAGGGENEVKEQQRNKKTKADHHMQTPRNTGEQPPKLITRNRRSTATKPKTMSKKGNQEQNSCKQPQTTLQ